MFNFLTGSYSQPRVAKGDLLTMMKSIDSLLNVDIILSERMDMIGKRIDTLVTRINQLENRGGSIK